MGLKSLIRKFRGPKDPKQTNDMDALKAHLIHDFQHFGACPCCLDLNRFLRGPEAGVSVNIMCASCGSRFNMTQLPGLTLLDWTHGPQDAIWGEHERIRYPEQEWLDKVEGVLTR